MPQQLHLVSSLGVEDNLLLAQYLAGLPQDRARAREVLGALGLAERGAARGPPSCRTGRRSASRWRARWSTGPALLLADEPTSNLDDAHCAQALELLESQARACGATLVVATHDQRVKRAIPNQLASERREPRARSASRYLAREPLNTALNLVLLALGVGDDHARCCSPRTRSRSAWDATRAASTSSPARRAARCSSSCPPSTISMCRPATFRSPPAKQLAQHRAVKKTIPLALGDSFRGFRIVGTNHDYVAHYGGEPAAGRLWREPMEAVLGAEVGARAPGSRVGGELHRRATASPKAARSTASARTRSSAC